MQGGLGSKILAHLNKSSSNGKVSLTGEDVNRKDSEGRNLSGISETEETRQYQIRDINEEHPEATVSLNFNDPTGDHIRRVFDKTKLYETRHYTDKKGNGKIPGAYLNKLVGLVQTGYGKRSMHGGQQTKKDIKYTDAYNSRIPSPPFR